MRLVRGGAQDADPAVGVLDHHEHVQAGAVQRAGPEEVVQASFMS
jgi:hypothetical protein